MMMEYDGIFLCDNSSSKLGLYICAVAEPLVLSLTVLRFTGSYFAAGAGYRAEKCWRK